MPIGLSFDFWNTLFAPGSETIRHELRVERLLFEARKLEEQAAAATAVLVYGLANLDHKLSREGYYVEKEEATQNETRRERRRRE